MKKALEELVILISKKKLIIPIFFQTLAQNMLEEVNKKLEESEKETVNFKKLKKINFYFLALQPWISGRIDPEIGGISKGNGLEKLTIFGII